MKFKVAIPLLAATSIALTACEEGQFLAAPPGDGQVAPAAAAEARTEIREVERADIFSAEELALWDGRPSLGGLWIAHPDVGDPERVRITNTTNGQSVFGALFRRERANPGPRIQLSSDAANALGILAGQPTELAVVVVRQEEVVIEPAPLPVDEPAEDLPEDESLAALPGDATAEPAEEEAPKRQGFFARLFGGGAAAAETPPEPEAPEGAAAPEVETEPLDPITASAAAAIDAAENTSQALSAQARPQRRATAAAAASTAAVVATPAPAATPPAPDPVATTAPAQPAQPAPSLNNPYVQVGLFTVEANASAAATGLRQGGIVPTIVPGTNATGTFWRVLVGPMTSAQDQTEILSQVKSLGYSDAFLVSN
jgi:cell division septation protein DedD